jgi:hypothetical protein
MRVTTALFLRRYHSPAAIKSRLESASPILFSTYAVLAAFSTYFCMYAFRKPFAAARYEDMAALDLGGLLIEYKTALIITQVIGYCTSKFLGIKVISEMKPERRALMIVACIGVAWFALLAFALIPAPWNILCLALNGLPLGMVWGLVFGFLEGRKVSEVLGVGLSASYILASGVVKGIGRVLMDAGIPEFWMPVATGACFAVPMGVFVFLLACLPPPTEDDVRARTLRAPMDAEARRLFFVQYLPGLLPLTLLYILLTAYRDFRDNFAVEIWEAVGYGKDEVATMLASSEVPVTVGVLGILAFLMFVRDNRKALLLVHVIMLTGTTLIGLSTLLFELGFIGPVTWMVMIGLGLYAAYVPYGCILFDRLIATVGAIGTAGFLIYVTDAFGYLGSVGLMLYKDIGSPDLSWLSFFKSASYITSIFCTTLYLVSLLYFQRLTRQHNDTKTSPLPS